MAVRENVQHSSILRWSGVLLFLLLWETAPRLGWVDPYFLPPFSTVVVEIFRLFFVGFLGIHILVSLWRALVGLTFALLIGVPLGYLLGRRFVGTAEVLQPVLTALSQVNPFSLLPVFLLFLGIGEVAKLAVICWVSLWPVIFYTITATRSVDPLMVKMSASLGISRREQLFKVILPASLPTIFVGVRISAGLTFFILMAAEMLGASAGVGYLVHNAAMNYKIPSIYAGSTLIVLLGYFLNKGLLRLERTLFVWQEKSAFNARSSSGSAAYRWRPGRRTALAAAALYLFLLVYGGWQVQLVNSEAADIWSDVERHQRHFGVPVGGGE
ncbi:MAG: ABC transporter permease [Desulfuromonadaceae bacterium]